MAYDSKHDTWEHIFRVRSILKEIALCLLARAEGHDASKLEAPEKAIFDEFTPKLKASTFGSEEYEGFRASMAEGLRHHYANNRHHPEFFNRLMWRCDECENEWRDDELPGPEEERTICTVCASSGVAKDLKSYYSIQDMTLVDLIEMLVDWKAASERHADGDIAHSFGVNKKRFGIADPVLEILWNTIKDLSRNDVCATPGCEATMEAGDYCETCAVKRGDIDEAWEFHPLDPHIIGREVDGWAVMQYIAAGGMATITFRHKETGNTKVIKKNFKEIRRVGINELLSKAEVIHRPGEAVEGGGEDPQAVGSDGQDVPGE